MRVEMSITLLALTMTAIAKTLGQEISFGGSFEYNQTCGLTDRNDWSADGTLTLTPADFIGFEPKMVVRAYHEICTVDLTSCPPDFPVKTLQPCFCRSRVGDTYHVHVGSRISRSQAKTALQAVVPGQGPLKNIFAAADIGTLPNPKDNQHIVNATYSLDNGKRRNLLFSQNVTVCSGKRVVLEICVKNDDHRATSLKLAVGDKITTVSGDQCIPHIIMPGHDQVIFEYKAESGCTQVHQMFIKQDDESCIVPTAKTVPTTTTLTTTLRTTAATEIPSTSYQIPGVCPNTPRTVTVLPSGDQILTDDVTHNASWTVFQRRISGEVDFYRPWADYLAGFGQINGSFWLGLEAIHNLCNQEKQCELLIHLLYDKAPFNVPKIADGCYHATYSTFWLGGAATNYTLHVSGYSGTAGDCLLQGDGSRHNLDGRPFSTMDRDNDLLAWDNCAQLSHGAWWYNNCKPSNLNGGWGRLEPKWSGVHWDALTDTYSVTLSEMKVRPLM